MANTVKLRTIYGGADTDCVIVKYHIISDGSEEVNTILFDNSTVWNVPSYGRLMKVQWSGSDCILRLSWDQTTDDNIVSINPINAGELEFDEFGGIRNPNEAGATGDLLLNTSNLDAGDEVTLIVELRK